MNQVMWEPAIGMLNAGMSIRAIAAQLNVHHSTIIRLRQHFQQTGRTANRPHLRHPRATTPAQDRYIRLVHLRDRFRPVTRTADETLGVNNRWTASEKQHCMLNTLTMDLTSQMHGAETVLQGLIRTFDGPWHDGEM
jgi:IS30 family transposase